MAGLYPQPKQPRNPFDQFDDGPEVNPFDQFDEKPEVNPFDQFDGLSKPPSIFQPKNAVGLFAQGALDQGAGSMAEGGLRLADTLGRKVLGELDAPDLVSARRELERAEDTLRAVSKGRMKADPGYEVIRDRARAEVARLTPAQQPALDAIAAKPGLIPAAKKVGEFRQAVREVYPVDAEVQESIPGQVVQGVGQALGGIPLFLTGLGLPASAAQLFDQGYQEATQSGADLETAAAAGLANVPAAVLEQVGDKFQLGSMVKALRGNAKGAKQIVKTALNAFAGEAGTEALQQGHQNAVAQALYDKDRQLTEGMGTAALVGGLTGATVATGATALGEVIAALDTRKNVAETTATLKAQQEQLLAGRRPAQMFPVNAEGKVTNELPLPEGMERLETERGVFHFNPQQITADEIFSESARGAENRALNLGSTSKPEAEAAAAQNNEPLVTITERTADGTEVRSSVINQSAAEKTMAEMQPGLTPGNRLTIETPQQTLAGRQPDFLADILKKDADALAARQAADAKELAARAERQRDLDAKKENVGEAMQLGDAVLQDQAATFAEVQGALKRVQFYAENNALGITQDQRIAAQRQQARLAQRLAALEPAEMARRDLENQKRLADDAAALAAQKAQRTQARQEFKQEEKAGRDATGALDYTRMSEDDLVTRAQAGDARAEKVLMQRADQQGDDRPTLLDVLARVKLPGTDAALGGELKLLAEGMTPQQRRQLIATKETGLDTVAEVLRADYGFSQIQTPADVLDFVERALRGEDIRPDRTGEGQVQFATASEPTAAAKIAELYGPQKAWQRVPKAEKLADQNKSSVPAEPRTRLAQSLEEIGARRSVNNSGPEFATRTTTAPADPADPAPRTDFRDAEEQRAYLRNPDNFNDRPFPGVVQGTPLWNESQALAKKSLELDTERRRQKLSFEEIETAARRATGKPWPDFTEAADYDRTLAELRNPGSQVGKFPGGQTEIEFATTQDTFDLGGTPVGIDLPNAVRNLTPRWQEKTLAFESSLDKALYYAGGTNSETRDLVANRLAQQTGLTTGQIATLARQLRDRIAPLTRSAATTGTIRVPAQMRSEVAAITGIDFATAAAPAPEPTDDATIQRELTALVRAFPRLAQLFKLRIGSIRQEFNEAAGEAGYKGQISSNVEAAVWGQKRLIVIAARAWRDRNNGAALLTHEVAHLFWDTLPTDAKAQLRALHAKETSTKTGPLYTAQGFMRGSIQFERNRLPIARVAADPELPVKEWFAERIAIINKAWAEGRLDRTETPLLRRLAFELRQLWRRIVETFATRSNIDPDTELFEAQFRAFILAGADVQIGRNAGTSYAQKKAQFAQRPSAETSSRPDPLTRLDQIDPANAQRARATGVSAENFASTTEGQFEIQLDDINLPAIASEEQREIARFGLKFNKLRERVTVDKDPTLLNIYITMAQRAEFLLADRIAKMDETEIVETVNAVGTETVAAALILRAVQENNKWPAVALIFKNGIIHGGTAGELVNERSRLTDYGALEHIAKSDPTVSSQGEGRIMRAWRQNEREEKSIFEIRGSTRNELKIALWKERATMRTARGTQEIPAKRLITEATSSPKAEFVARITPETARMMMARTGLTPEAFWNATKKGDVTLVNQLAQIPSPIRKQFARAGRYIGPIAQTGALPITRAPRNFSEQGTIEFATSKRQAGPDVKFATVSKLSKKNDYLRVGTSRLGTEAVPLTTPATSNIHGKMVPAELLAKQMPYVNYPHLPRSILAEQNPVAKRDKFVEWMKDNLLALYEAFPADVRARATQWYDGANTIATDFSARFDTTLEQASGVLAVLSPQKDWFMNVAQAEQVMDIWKNHQKTVITEQLVREQLEDIISGALATPSSKRKGQPDESPLARTRRRNANARLDQAAKDERRQLLEPIIGKTLQQLNGDPYLQGWAIRVLAQSIHGREFRIISPEGRAMGLVTTKDGESRKNGWGSINEIEKAVRILRNGNLTNISENLGDEHKVRNFYNNIVAPNTPFGDATMDTHAVAAAHIMPFGSSAVEVEHNFGIGVPGSGPLGVSGIYHLYIDAYTAAAKEVGLMPRQLQSITWEAIRQLYSAESRRDKNVVAAAANTWKINTNARARTQLLGKGISSPSWARATNDEQPQGKPTKAGRKGDSDDTRGSLRFRGPNGARGGLDQPRVDRATATDSRGTFDSPDPSIAFATGPDSQEDRLQQIRDELDQLQNSQEDQSEINARGQALTDEREQILAEQRAEQREQQVENNIIDVRHPAAVGTPEPGEAWMMVPRMSDAQLRQERMDVGQHLVDNYQDLGRAGRSLLNARIDAIRAEEARRAPQPRRDAEGNALVDPIPKTSRRDALIAELQRGRAMAGEANRTGNDKALKEGTRLVRLAKERLDEEFPGWETAARPTTAQAPSAAPDATDTQPGPLNATPPPRPSAPPIAETAQPDDAEPSPFTGESEEKEPIRKGKIAEVYGHSSYQPGVVVRTWRKVRDTFVGIRGPIPELPVFPGSALNADDRFIKEKGPQFYNGLREFYRALKSGNDYIQRTAEEQVARITRPLIEAGGSFDADDYAKLQTEQRNARTLRAEGKIVPPGKLAEIAALQSKMESNPYVLFNRLVLMLDLKWRHENLKDSRGNPIALPSSLNRTEVNAELARLGQTIQAGPHAALIRTALDRHMQLVKDVAADLQSRELIAAEQLANPYYFPHVTLQITRGDKTVDRELTPTRVRPGTEADFRGYLQDPVGSRKPIETDYVRALYYHLVQVGAHNLKADAIAQHARPYDVMAEVRARAEQLSRTRGESVSWEQAFNEEFEPAGYVRYGTDSRDAFPTIMVDRDKLARRLGRELTSEDLQQQLARLGMDGVRLMPEDLKETLMAGNRETWIVPARVAEALRGIADREKRTSGEIDAAAKWALGKWKAWKLFMPWNHIRYEYGNIVADIEKVFSATPGTFMTMPEAAREIRAFWLGGEPSADLRAALKDGVINAPTAQEMGGLVRLRAFKEFETTADKVQNAIKRRGSSLFSRPIAEAAWTATALGNRAAGGDMKLFAGLGDFSTPELSAFREAVFRYANFKHNLGRLRAGERPDYGGAYNRDIDAMQDSKPGANDRAQRQAGQISKATFGDYGDISVLGQTMRDKLIPFYSWMEVNFKYHANLFRNLRDMVRANEVSKIEAAGKGARAAATFAAGFGARAAGGFVLRLALPYVAVALWNGGLGAVAGAWDEDDEIEKDLSEEDRRRFHIILGRNADGTVNIVYGQTALVDITKWFSGARFAQQAGAYLNGKTDFPTALAEWRDNLVPDFLNNTVGSFGPYAKIPAIGFFKKNPFPDVTEMRSVPAYDMWRVIGGQITDEFTADMLTRIVNKDYYGARDFGTWAKQLVLQVRQRDPEAWAFYAIKDKAAEFVERQTGTKRESSYDAPDQQVLRNFRRAIYNGDVDKAVQFYQRLLDYGYTADRFKQSIRAQEPLAGLPKENGLRAAFVAGLTPDERRLLDRAQSYYTRINSQRGEERGLFPSDRSGAAGLQRFQANPQVDRLRQTMEQNRQLDDDARRLQAERALQNSLKNNR